MKQRSTLALALLFFCFAATQSASGQNVGIGDNNPGSKFAVKGNLGVGTDYSTLPAPANGIIIEGRAGIGTSTPDTNSILELSSTSKGVLIPRMTTTQRDLINVSDSAASQGMLVFNITTKCLESYIGTSWQPIGCGCTSAPGMPSSFLTSVSPVCQQGSGYTYSITEIAGASNYIWKLPNGASIANGTGTSSITVNFGLNATPGSNDTISVAASNSCGTSPALIETITVNQVPTINSQPSNSTICGSGASYTGNTSFSVSATGTSLAYQWQVNTGSGFTNISNGGIYSNATTSTLNISGATPTNNGYQFQCVVSGTCSPAATSSIATLTVNTVPAVTNSTTASICSGTGTGITLTSTVSSTFAWTLGTVTGSISGASASNGGTISQTLTDPSNTTSGTVPYIVVPTSTAGSCIGNSATITVTVNPAPTVTNSNAKTICDGTGTGISLTSGISSTFAWTLGTITGSITGASAGSGSSISQTLADPSNATSGTVPYIVVPTSTANSCVGSSTTITVTVNPTPVVTTANTESICSGTGTGLSLTATASSTFAWTLGTNTGSISGTSAGSGSSISQTLGNPSNSTAGSIVYNVTPTASSCAGSAYPITVTVNPIPSVSNSSTASICNATSPNISLTASAASTFAWTLGTVTGSISGASASSGSTINQTLTDPSSTASGTVPYVVVPTSTTGSCAGSSTTITVTVTPTPAVTTANTATICSGASTGITLADGGVASSYAWTIGTITGSITGASAGSGSSISQTLSNPSNSTAGTVQYFVTPTSTTNSCVGSAYTITVTVNPTPTISSTPSSVSLCSGAAPSIALSSSASGTTYTWTVAQGSGISGGSNCSSSCGSTIAQTLSNSSNTTAATAIYTVTGSANSCTASTSDTVTVNPVPAITAAPSSTAMCSGSTTSIGLSSSLAGTTYAWSVAQSSLVTGGSNGTGTPIAQALANTTNSTSATATYTITGTDPVNSCSATITSVVTVNPIPIITASPSTPTICSGAAPSVALTSSVTTAATTFAWSVAQGTGISGGSSSTGTPIAQTLSNSSNTTSATATYTITGTSSSCTATATATVTVNPLPTVSLAAGTSTFCLGASTTLTASPANGSLTYSSYAWTGSGLTSSSTTVVGNSATPTSTGSQSYTVKVTDNNGCQSTSGSISVTVNPLPTITTSATAAGVTVSSSSQNSTLAYSATTNSPTNYTITWNSAAHTAGLVDVSSTTLPATPITVPVAANVVAGTYTGTLTVTNANSCASAGNSFTLTVSAGTTLDNVTSAWVKGSGMPQSTTSNTISTTVANEMIIIVIAGGGNAFAVSGGASFVKVDGNAATQYTGPTDNNEATGGLCTQDAGSAIFIYYYVASGTGSHTITTSASGVAPGNNDYGVFAAAFIKSSGSTFSSSNLNVGSGGTHPITNNVGSGTSTVVTNTSVPAGSYLIAVSLNQNTQTSGGSNAFTWGNVAQTPFGGAAAAVNFGTQAWPMRGSEQIEAAIAGVSVVTAGSQTVTSSYSNTGQCANLLTVFWISTAP